MPELPTGTVTFLFTDIEGSTRLLADAGSDYAALLEEHRRLIRDAVEGNGGTTFGTEGDAVFAVFTGAGGALTAAADMQRGLLGHSWPDGRHVRVRAGIHSGEVTMSDGGYVGMAIHEVARISAAGHGGQVLVSPTTRELAADAHLPTVGLRDLGEHRLKDVGHPVRLYQLVGDGLPQDFPPLRTLTARTDNLPPPLTSFIDRGEVDEGQQLMRTTRLLTLTGPGGTGKTRLALELAGVASVDFSNGVTFVALDAVRDPELVPSAIVGALGLPPAPGFAAPLQRVLDHLRDRSALLVLDNFEQVVEAAPVVAQLLREAPGIKVLATSRIPLRISGEQDFPIPPLAVPPERTPTAEEALRSEAVALFVDRARAARPDFRFGDENASAVVDIVRRLDGLPLAIELAAARLRVLSVETLRERLDRRLAVLTGGARDVPARQQTLRDTIDWSYELLDPADRKLFERFGVFASAACLVEAEPVCGPPEELGEEVLDGLVSLSEKSLLRPVPRAIEEPRFAMLATIREFASDRFTDRPYAEAVRRRHAQTYTALVEASAPQFFGRQARGVLDRLEQDHDNLRLALQWAIQRGEAHLALRFLASVWRFWQLRGHLVEGWQWAQRVLALPKIETESPALRARAFGAAGSLAYWHADVPSTHRLYRDALEQARVAGDPAILAEALQNFGFVPDPGLVNTAGGLHGPGRPYLEEAVRIYREIGHKDGLASATWALASVRKDAGDIAGARELMEESLALSRETDNFFGLGWALFGLGVMSYFVDGPSESLPKLGEALQVFAEAGDVAGITTCLLGLTSAMSGIGASDHRWRLAGACYTQSVSSGILMRPEDIGFPPLDRPINDAAAAQRWDEGAAMTLDEAVAYGLKAAEELLSAVPKAT